MDKFLKWFNGKKTIIAALYWELSAGAIIIWYPTGLPEQANKIYLTLGMILTTFGLGHKIVKNIKVK
jgi:hypothetical protein